MDEYFNSNTFTGGHFERFAGGGDRPEVADRFTNDDVVAVSLLSVDIPGQAALQLLDAQANELNALVSGIPVGSDLWQAAEEPVAPVPQGHPAGRATRVTSVASAVLRARPCAPIEVLRDRRGMGHCSA